MSYLEAFAAQFGKGGPPERIWLVNLHTTGKAGTVYIGRPSKWGNPYSHLPEAGEIRVLTREEAVRRYVYWLWESQRILAIGTLEDRTLSCWCTPQLCHGNVLRQILTLRGQIMEVQRFMHKLTLACRV